MHTSTCLKHLLSFSISFSACFISQPTIFSSPALRGLSFLSTYTCTPRTLNIPNSNLIQRQASHVASLAFTALALQRSEVTIWSILHHPFNQKALDNTLPLEIFKRYLREDIAYIQNYIALLEKISMRNSCSRLHRAFFNNLQQTQSNALQRCYQYLEKHERIFSKSSLSSGCRNYIDHLQRLSEHPSLPVILSGFFSCYLTYRELGFHHRKNLEVTHLYKTWIETYASEKFFENVEEKAQLLNILAQEVDPSILEDMLHAFETSTQCEYAFWDSIYHNT